MSDRRWIVGGLVFAAVGIVAAVLLPPPPAADAGAPTLQHYFGAHSAAIRAASTLSALGALALIPFFSALRDRLPGVAGGAVYGGGLITVAVSVLGDVLQAGLANAHARLDGAGLLAFFGIERGVFYVAPAVTTVAVASAAAVAFRAAGLPFWLTGLSGLLAVFSTAGAVATLVSESTAAGGIGLAGFILVIVWTAATSMVVMRERGGASDQVARAAVHAT